MAGHSPRTRYASGVSRHRHRRWYSNASSSSGGESSKLPQLPVRSPLDPSPAEARCSFCAKQFATLSSLRAHLANRHSPRVRLPPRKVAKARCPTCKEDLATSNGLAKHLATMTNDHGAASELRNVEESFEDMMHPDRFSEYDPVMLQSLQHCTSAASRASLESSSPDGSGGGGGVLRGSKDLMSEHVGALAHREAPGTVYFTVSGDADGSVPRITFFPADAEPGEELAKVLVNLEALVGAAGYRLFLMDIHLTSFGKVFMANTSFVVMLAREPAHVAFGARHGVELDKHDNPLLRFDADAREWTMAKRFDTRLSYVHDMSAGSGSSSGSSSGSESPGSAKSESGWRPLRLVVAVAGDVNLGEIRPRPRWMTVYRMEKHPEKDGICPYCSKAVHEVVNHIRTKHEGVSFDCDRCDQSYSSRKQLATHIDSVHEGIKISCRLCHTTFHHPGSLRKHMATVHAGYTERQIDAVLNLSSTPHGDDHLRTQSMSGT